MVGSNRAPDASLSSDFDGPAVTPIPEILASRGSTPERAENIGASVHFIPIHLHPDFQDRLGVRAGDFPVTEDAYRRAVTLPLFPDMTPRDVGDVVTAVRKVAGHHLRRIASEPPGSRGHEFDSWAWLSERSESPSCRR